MSNGRVSSPRAGVNRLAGWVGLEVRFSVVGIKGSGILVAAGANPVVDVWVGGRREFWQVPRSALRLSRTGRWMLEAAAEFRGSRGML